MDLHSLEPTDQGNAAHLRVLWDLDGQRRSSLTISSSDHPSLKRASPAPQSSSPLFTFFFLAKSISEKSISCDL